jgi:hypothetical protein
MVLAASCLLAGCSYQSTEPGLFQRSTSRETTAPPIRPVTPDETSQVPNPDLPVVGEAIWTSADGLDITMRIAVHAVRRIAGGSVLDWSITPLHGPGLGPNDLLPRSLNLGLSRPHEEYPNIVLVDAARSKVYRPLTPKPSDSRCLCTPLPVAQRNLRIDHTTLLQIAYPSLPPELARVDVELPTVPPFWQVPVTPAGMLPLASYPTDLTRAAEGSSVVASTRPFTYRSAGQRYLIMINRVYAGSSFTSIAWTIHSLETGRGLETASTPPLAEVEPHGRTFNPVSAGGPQIVLGDHLLRVRLVTNKLTDQHALECLCTDLRTGAAALRSIGQQIGVVTNLPPLPAATTKVDIVLPGLTTLTDVAVTVAPDASFRSAGPAVRDPSFWTYRAQQPHPGWAPRDWPTPVPRQFQFRSYQATVDTIVR